jgi:2-hydroxyglutarate dehydrogenase
VSVVAAPTSHAGSSGAAPPERCDIAVVGGGLIGLAVARELQLAGAKARSVCVLEREQQLGTHQTGHNSGVVHSGIYYAPGSLKARLCVSGARELAEFCDRNAVPYAPIGKLIVAARPSQLPALAELERRARLNGVAGVRRLDAAGLLEVEPHAAGIAALHCPTTAIVEFPAVAAALAREVEGAGGTIATGCGVRAVEERARTLRLSHDRGETQASWAVFCAGAWADRLAVAAGADRDPRIVPFRGAYLRLAPNSARLVRGLVYPVPDPALPFLGVHITPTVSGEVLIGPTALVAPARDAYRLGTVRAHDLAATLAWPGTWRMARRWWRTGAAELCAALAPALTVRAARRLLPELSANAAEPAFAGVRAQAVGRDGRLLDDFAFSRTARALHVRNAPSPGATSALAIARHVAGEAASAFGL